MVAQAEQVDVLNLPYTILRDLKPSCTGDTEFTSSYTPSHDTTSDDSSCVSDDASTTTGHTDTAPGDSCPVHIPRNGKTTTTKPQRAGGGGGGEET